MACCFFGHKDTPASIVPTLGAMVDYLIQERNVTEFLVGNQGSFDRMVYHSLKEASSRYPHITYHVVLAYMPEAELPIYENGETFLPEGIENVPPKYAISWRNKWMVREADICVCYVTHSWGGAAQYVKYAKNQGKEVINLHNDNLAKNKRVSIGTRKTLHFFAE